MIEVNFYKGKKVAVFGLGKSGIGAIKALAASRAEVHAWDDNQNSVENLKKESLKGVKVEDARNYDWKNFAALVLSPGVPLTHPKPHWIVELARAANCPIICDVELLWQAVPEAKYIAITGTNGKSTTTALTGHILKNAGIKTEVGGNIGVSVLELQKLDKNGIYVLELSSFQLDLIQKARFNVAVILNITPDHLDRHGDMKGYAKAKERIFMNQSAGDVAVVGQDDDYCIGLGDKLKKAGKVKVVGISNNHKTEGVYAEKGMLHDIDGNKEFQIDAIKNLPGQHNWQNMVAAYAACSAAGVDSAKIMEGIKTFPGLKHRIERVGEINGTVFINDSKATNADAAEKALLCFDNIYWIAGGLAKEGGIDSLNGLFPKIKHAFLVGKAQDNFAEVLKGKVQFTKSGDLKTALADAAKMAFAETAKNASARPIVLLSPACASFDQWKSFEERGDKFREMVAELKKETEKNNAA